MTARSVLAIAAAWTLISVPAALAAGRLLRCANQPAGDHR